MLVLWALVAFTLIAALALWRQKVALARAHFIRSGELPRGLFANLQKRRPGLTLKDCQLVAQALRQFFLAYLQGGKQPVSMPSQVVDELWHEFILFTRNYEVFCRRAFGGFLHHAPAVTLSDNRRANAGLRRVWWWACKAENIDPRKPTRLPLLFAIDAKLAVAGGFVYALDCHAALVRQHAEGDGGGGTVIYCAGDFGSSSFDGGTDGFGDSSGDGGDGGGCGGGG